ncbi:MAG: GyrI-like domain-containing protein, partial [Desulfocucumaceae bacterium]
QGIIPAGGVIRMVKTDHKKELKHLYNSSSREVTVVDVPPMNFLMLDGEGDPNTSGQFQEAVEALYSLSYTIKFMIKKGKTAVDYSVMPLEGLWRVDDMAQFSIEAKAGWKWTLMIMQPGYVIEDLFEAALEQAGEKKNLPALTKTRFESFHEGLSVQIMHVGPYSEEGPTVKKIHSYIKGNGFEFAGRHHEIYLSDPRRSDPEKMKTIIRQPINTLRLP